MKRILTAVIVVVVLVGLRASVKGVTAGSPMYTVRGTVYDFETGLRLGKCRHVPEITRPTCEGWYEIRDEEGNLLEEGLAVKIVETAKLVFGEEVAITVHNLSGEVVLRDSTKSDPPQEGHREGNFQLELAAGSYRVVFAKEGYELKEMAMIVPWPGSEEFQYEIYLTPKVSYRDLSPSLPWAMG